jgi:translation initiation factor 1 (eIF-1/SUI1)
MDCVDLQLYCPDIVAYMTTFVPHTDMATMTMDNTPVVVVYCTICGLPSDYCQYGPSWDKHPGAQSSDSAPQQNQAPVVATTKASGGAVIIKIAPRVGRRYLTTISGLEQFDVDIAKACKVFAKKFACGVGKKDDSGEIEIQGDVEESVVSTITGNWPQIKSKHITIKRKEK